MRMQTKQDSRTHSMKPRISLTLAALLLAPLAGHGADLAPTGGSHTNSADIYVSPDGSDDNPGTEAAPFRTLEKARDAAREVIRTAAEDVRINLRGGWHVLGAPLKLSAEDSGTNGHRIIYQAYAGEKPILSGGRQVRGWTLHDETRNLWKAAVPGLNTRQLFVNGTRAVRAHLGTVPKGWVKTTTGYAMSDAGMEKWRNVSDIELIFNARLGGLEEIEWPEPRCGIAGISGTNVTMKQPCWGTIALPPPPGVRCEVGRHLVTVPTDIENAYEQLDQPGEWYLDRSAGVIYYLPLPGENLNTAQVIAPVLESLVSGAGTPDAPIHDIEFKGITFLHTTWLLPSTNEGLPEYQANNYWFADAGRDPEGGEVGKSGQPASSVSVAAYATTYDDHSGFAAAAVSFLAARHVRIERCSFGPLGGTGLALSGGSQDCAVAGCVFTDISDNGLRVGQLRRARPADPRMEDRRIQIVNCYIHRVACEYRGGVGIMAGYAADLLIAHNEVEDVPYSGMSVGWGWGRVATYAGNYEIACNEVHGYTKSLTDGGAIYMTGSNSSVHHNYCHDAGMDSGYMRCLYTDDGSGFVEVHHNVCERVGREAEWYAAWTPTIHDIAVHDNYADTGNALLKGINCTFTNNHVVQGGQWPEEARAIMAGAGLEPGYRDILRTECPCQAKPANAPQAPAR